MSSEDTCSAPRSPYGLVRLPLAQEENLTTKAAAPTTPPAVAKVGQIKKGEKN